MLEVNNCSYIQHTYSYTVSTTLSGRRCLWCVSEFGLQVLGVGVFFQRGGGGIGEIRAVQNEHREDEIS